MKSGDPASPETFEIFDVRGRRVAAGLQTEMGLVKLPSGVYYVERHGKAKTTRKMLVIK